MRWTLAKASSVLLLGPLTAQSTWQQVPAAEPTARQNHVGAFDIVRQRLVVHGGGVGTAVFGDTIEFDGTSWSTVSASGGPGLRWAAGMAFDPVTSTVVLFGGTSTFGSNQGLDDTWSWNGTTWTQLVTAHSPPARLAHAMVTDLVNGRIVLHGGRGTNGQHFADTWIFDGVDWSPLPVSGPPPRCCSAMAQDLQTGEILLFGGWNGQTLGDTWRLTTNQWTALAPTTAPSIRWGHRMALAPQLGRIVLHGGMSGSSVQDTWLWTGTTWVQLSSANGGLRINSIMDSDLALGRVLMFGGGTSTSGTIETGQLWQLVGGAPASWSAFGSGCGAGPLTLVAVGSPSLGSVCNLVASPVPVLGVFVFGVSDQTAGGVSLPLSLASLGAPGCWLYTSVEALVSAVPGGQQVGIPLAIPFRTALLGARVYAQAASFEPTANPFGFVTSNAQAATIGW